MNHNLQERVQGTGSCVEHCVRESIEKGEGADEKIEELTTAVERF